MTAPTSAHQSNDHDHHHDHHDDHEPADRGVGDHHQDHESDGDRAHAPRGPVERLVLGAINLYRLTAPARTPRCRYIPTCSTYAVEAVEVHGLGRGLWLAVRRLGRCHPFGSFGFDPVPEKQKNSNTPERT